MDKDQIYKTMLDRTVDGGIIYYQNSTNDPDHTGVIINKIINSSKSIVALSNNLEEWHHVDPFSIKELIYNQGSIKIVLASGFDNYQSPIYQFLKKMYSKPYYRSKISLQQCVDQNNYKPFIIGDSENIINRHTDSKGNKISRFSFKNSTLANKIGEESVGISLDTKTNLLHIDLINNLLHNDPTNHIKSLSINRR